jgi:ATP-dependent DNA ligase
MPLPQSFSLCARTPARARWSGSSGALLSYKEGATSLYLGKREGREFFYAGKAGTGYTNKMIGDLYRLMKPITLQKMPLTKKPKGKKIDKWVEPRYWAEVEYRDITADGLLRHVTFRGLYESKQAKKPLVAKFNPVR